MKKLLACMLALCLLFAAVGCAPAAAPAPEAPAAAPEAPAVEPAPAPEAAKVTAEEVRGVTVPPFSIMINGTTVTNEVMVAYPVYSVQAFSINSSGTESTCNYVGFAISDVLAAVGITDGFTNVEAAADDGYAIVVDAAVAKEPTTLLAVTKDGEQFKDGPWFAPCSSETTGDYLKGMSRLNVDADVTITPDVGEPAPAEDAPAAALPEISDKTDKVEFKPYEFIVNGEKVTNDKLAGLSIYKITVTTVNSKGNASESTYTGYKLADVLAACGAKDYTEVIAVANDGYENKMDKAAADSDYTLLAIEKDKELGEDGTIWVAPCEQTESKAYAKLVVEVKTA
ncbi:MAG: hypothetical protein PHO41_05470 [Eubacteriales bacterium]|nr:hypothetical protein [Eubacteriales bacterium]